MDFNLKGVNKTLLLPLCGRYLHSTRKDSDFYDADAVKLIESLYEEVDNLLRVFNETESCYFLDRALAMDDACQQYLKQYPNASIVNIGSGLDTAFSRNDNGQLTWYELDMPNVIALREKFFATHSRQHLLATSVYDMSWCDDIDTSHGVLLLCSGVFNYFPLDDVMSLIGQLASYFRGGQMSLDVMGDPIGLYYANKMVKKGHADEAKIQWYLNKSFQHWPMNITKVDFMPFYQHLPMALKLKFTTRLKIALTKWLNSAQYCHITF